MTIGIFSRLLQSVREALNLPSDTRSLRFKTVAHYDDARAAGKAVIQKRRRLMERLSR